ncbi:hypothetical protein MKW94_001550 [Papaver nudicaule]|uniref:Pathogen-related protein n=1 Tax=Papaver nudicaule TaxID=74823 RepID=A0AA42AWR0_PAPNU|nr:hypothetical protein [Papaver nudicaule]
MNDSSEMKQDKYRSYLYGEGEKDTQWRNGLPNYDAVNKLFEEGRTQVQNLVKTWEMEMVHKVRLADFKSIDPAKFTFSKNVDSANVAFTTTFPRGFAIEILQVYAGPPVIVFKFRHWGFKEGPFKGHAPTGEKVEFYGIGIFTLDERKKIVKVEFFYERGELLAALIKGDDTSGSSVHETTSGCPFLKG